MKDYTTIRAGEVKVGDRLRQKVQGSFASCEVMAIEAGSKSSWITLRPSLTNGRFRIRPRHTTKVQRMLTPQERADREVVYAVRLGSYNYPSQIAISTTKEDAEQTKRDEPVSGPIRKTTLGDAERIERACCAGREPLPRGW